MQRLEKSLHDAGEVDHPVISDGLRQVQQDLKKKPNQIHRRDLRIAVQGALRQTKKCLLSFMQIKYRVVAAFHRMLDFMSRDVLLCAMSL